MSNVLKNSHSILLYFLILKYLRVVFQYWIPFQMKGEFIARKLKEKYGESESSRKMLSAEEMSQFYKSFLDDHRLIHFQYNKEWYKRNMSNLILAARVWVEQTFKTRRK